MASRQRLIVGISGASGAIYGIRALELARAAGVETHLVVSQAALLTLHQELGLQKPDLAGLADVLHPAQDVGATIASGSFRTAGMLIAPCSVRSLGEIASGVTSSLLTRSADVVLKERRRLVILLRETPLTLVHIRNMATVTEMGGIIAPPLPAFYTRPESIDDLVNHSVGRALDLFGLDTGRVKRWQGMH